MNILYYNGLDYKKVNKQFEKTVAYLKAGDFASADVKKMVQTGFYRAKLDDTNRLLFKFARLNETTYLLLLEVIYNHAYDKSRFLRGATIDESKLKPLSSAGEVEDQDHEVLVYLNPRSAHFHLLDKVISFDRGRLRACHE